jgi:hypothetical protein
MQMIFRGVRFDRKGAIDDAERLFRPTAKHLGSGQKPQCHMILRMRSDRPVDDIGRFVKLSRPQQQLGGMQCVEAIFRCQRQCLQGESYAFVAVAEREFGARQLAQHPAVCRLDGRGAHQISDRVLVTAGSFVLTRRMSGKFDGIRSKITGPAGVEYRAVELPSGGK